MKIHRTRPGRGAGMGPATAPDAPLTNRQRDYMELLFEVVCRDARRPTVREIMARFGMKSTNAVMCHLYALHAKGYIRLGGVMRRGGDFAILRRPDGRLFKGLTPVD